MTRAARRCSADAPRIRNYACVTRGETVVPGPVLTDPAAITRLDLVFIAVKTTQNADSAGWLRAFAMKIPWSARCKMA
jgi:ketopantoate reductase